MAQLKIKTPNPQALKDTLETLPGGTHTVDLESYDGDVVLVETTNLPFLLFACTQQGYGQVVE